MQYYKKDCGCLRFWEKQFIKRVKQNIAMKRIRVRTLTDDHDKEMSPLRNQVDNEQDLYEDL